MGKVLKHELDAGRFLWMLHQALVLIAIAKGNIPAVPQALGGPLLHFVSGAVRRHLPFELGKVEQDVS
ncbi:MAG: hypothetical protein H8K11_17725 [Nitrospira sp.]|nr:hypothetical protein [Nitrospira sp.]